jgi:hypothetical protein
MLRLIWIGSIWVALMASPAKAGCPEGEREVCRRECIVSSEFSDGEHCIQSVLNCTCHPNRKSRERVYPEPRYPHPDDGIRRHSPRW